MVGGYAMQEACGAMSSFSVGGLSTGLDTKTIIDQLISIDSRSKTRFEWNKSLWSSRQSGWNELSSKLTSLKSVGSDLISPLTWNRAAATAGSTMTATSTNSSQVGAAVVSGGAPTAGNYNVDVLQLATGAAKESVGSLSAATSGVRETGIFYRGANNPALTTTRLTSLRTQAGGATGLNLNSKITMNYTVNGNAQSAEYTVTATTLTLQNLADWAATTIGNGATASVVGGQVRITTAAGTTNELDALSFSAVNSAGTVLPNFNSLAGATSSTAVAAHDGGAVGAQTLTIQQGASTWNVAIADGDGVNEIAAKINGTSGIGVSATVAAGKLTLASLTTGAASSFSFSSDGDVAGKLAMANTVVGQDARFQVNGTLHTSATNYDITSAITDVELDLYATTGAPVQVKVGDAASGGSSGDPFIEGLVKKVRSFVDKYNEILGYVESKSGEKRVTNPKSLSEYTAGALGRDHRFSSIGTDLRRVASGAVAGLDPGENMLSDIGISAQFQIGSKTNGQLALDEDKLRQALTDDIDKVQDVLARVGGAGPSADDGVFRRLTETLSQYVSADGKVGSAIQNTSTQISSLQKSIDRAATRLELRRASYERMFATLETNVGKMQGQLSWMNGQIASMFG